MKGKYLRSYVSKNGNDTFVYTVTGTPAQLEQFKAAQGDNYRESEDGTPLFFTTRFAGDNVNFMISQTSGRVTVDNSEFKKAHSLVKQYGGNLGQEMAKAAAARLVGGSTSTATEAQPAAATTGLGNM